MTEKNSEPFAACHYCGGPVVEPCAFYLYYGEKRRAHRPCMLEEGRRRLASGDRDDQRFAIK